MLLEKHKTRLSLDCRREIGEIEKVIVAILREEKLLTIISVVEVRWKRYIKRQTLLYGEWEGR